MTHMNYAQIRKYVKLLHILYINTMDLNLTTAAIVRVFSFKKAIQYNPCRTITLTNDHPSYTTIFRVTDSVFCLYDP